MKANNSYPKLSEIKNYSRPKSFSEGYKLTNQFPKQDEFAINQDYDEIPEQRSEEQELKSIGFCAVMYTKIIGFLFHLVLISIFELLFFNYYIIHYEDNALISLTNQLISPIINSCESLPNNNKIIIDDFVNIFINKTIINNNALIDYNSRLVFNHNLYINSICYSIGVIVTFLLVLISNYYFKQIINFKMVLLDNVIMICILGGYEFIFFNNIIFKYMTVSPNELIKIIVTNLLQSC
jgi:hypothetical protein